MFLSLEAKIENKQMYAQVISKVADLYHIPSVNGDKKFNHFKKGDMVPIEYCDRSSWCKTSDGYVKKKLLLIPEPILRNVVVMRKYKIEPIKEVQSEVVVLTPTVTPIKTPIATMENLPKPEKYAKISSNYADLYNIPNQDAQRKANFFKKGDTVGLIYCDKSTWCKTSNGYVKKDFLSMLDDTVAVSPKIITEKTVDKPIPVVVEQKIVTPNKLHDNRVVYAKLLPSKANLYDRPYFDSKQSVGYFQKGDRIKIDYCDNYGWCKTTNGYIRQNDIIFSEHAIKAVRTNYQVEPIKRVILKQKLTHLEKRRVITKTKYVRVVEDIGEYEEYFKDDSAKVVFKGGE